jgi:hypothetical protein
MTPARRQRRQAPRCLLLAFVFATSLPTAWRGAAAADLDAKEQETAREATRLYKQGRYAEAAELFGKLSVDHPDMPIFERNVGACFYKDSAERDAPLFTALDSGIHRDASATVDISQTQYCHYGGWVYRSGDVFPCGCSTCWCNSDGLVVVVIPSACIDAARGVDSATTDLSRGG